MSDFSVIGFTNTYPNITLKAKESNRQEYDKAILFVYINECKSGFKVKKIYETNGKGTKVKYEAIKDKNDFADYMGKVKKLVDLYNKEYGTNLKLS